MPLVASYQLFILRGSLLGATPRFVVLILLARAMFVRRTVAPAERPAPRAVTTAGAEAQAVGR